jgi:hypothetical protein
VLIQAEEQHRSHAVVEQVFAELIDGPLAHLPSGRVDADNAWLTLTAIAHDLTRAAAILAGYHYALARAATVRRQMINLAGRFARHARSLTVHLPEHWPWQQFWDRLFTTVQHHQRDRPHATSDAANAASNKHLDKTHRSNRRPRPQPDTARPTRP